MINMVVGEPLTLFIETIFELSDVIDFDHIEYGPLFYTIATFCMFEVRSKTAVLFLWLAKILMFFNQFGQTSIMKA